MMKLYITFTRLRLFVFCALTVLAVCLCGRFSAASNLTQDGKTNADRVSFAESVGCKVDETAVNTKKVIIPEEFSDVYENYNSLQNQAGYDLTGYKGCEVTLYTYKVTEGGIVNEETFINLLVYRNRIIGGDMQTVSLEGKMLPLKKISYGEYNGKTKTG